MWQILLPLKPKAQVLALQMHAERAGCAWACPFSSSEEFEAAVISSRVRAGAYGQKRRYRHMFYAIALIGAAAAGCLFI